MKISAYRKKLIVAALAVLFMAGFFWAGHESTFRFIGYAMTEPQRALPAELITAMQTANAAEIKSRFFVPDTSDESIAQFLKDSGASVKHGPIAYTAPFRFSRSAGEDGSILSDIAVIVHFQDRYQILVQMLLHSNDTSAGRIVRLNLIPEEQARAAYGFLRGKVPNQSFVFLALWGISFGVFVWAIASCLVDRPKKWPLWVLFILWGVGFFSFSWTYWDPSEAHQIINFQFLAFNIQATVFGPWVFTMSFPLGAVAYLVSTCRRREKPQKENPEEVSAT